MHRHHLVREHGVRTHRTARTAGIDGRGGGWRSALLAGALFGFTTALSAAGGGGPEGDRRTDEAPRPGATSRPTWIEPLTLGDGASRPEATPTSASMRAGDRWQNARVVLHLRDVGDGLPQSLSGLLELLGAEGVERRLVDIEVGTDHVRYFHVEDAAAAKALAATLGPVLGPIDVRDFTHYRPRPSSRLLEVWLR